MAKASIVVGLAGVVVGVQVDTQHDRDNSAFVQGRSKKSNGKNNHFETYNPNTWNSINGSIFEFNDQTWANECLSLIQITKGLPQSTSEEDLSKFTNMGNVIAHSDIEQQRAGVCMDTFTCAFKWCRVGEVGKTGEGFFTGLSLLNAYNETEDGKFTEYVSEDFTAKSVGVKAELNLPSYISFPQSVVDVQRAVQWAKDNCRLVSVRSTGHSYHGSSMEGDSVLLNMDKFPVIVDRPMMNAIAAKQVPPILSCEPGFISQTFPGKTIKDFPACLVAQSRLGDKTATVRVGGGSQWGDALKAVNEANFWFKIMNLTEMEIVTGAAATVGAAGGWIGGGGLGIGMERRNGIGVDNAVMFEMVLPSAEHVRFYPCEWESKEGKDWPQTTKVCGQCNRNVVEDETLWKWEDCSPGKGVSWGDLWHAVRGGGGGAWGVNTAVTYMAHPKEGNADWITAGSDLDAFNNNTVCPTWLDSSAWNGDPTTERVFASMNASNKAARAEWEKANNKQLKEGERPYGCEDVYDAFTEFYLNLWFDWEKLAEFGLTEQDSLNCGSAGSNFIPPSNPSMICMDGSADVVSKVWAGWWTAYKNKELPTFPEGRIPANMDWDSWSKPRTVEYWNSFIAWNEIGETGGINMTIPNFPWMSGQGGGINIGPRDSMWSAAVPRDFILQKNKDGTMQKDAKSLLQYPGMSAHIMGGNLDKLGDGTASIPQALRDAAFQNVIIPTTSLPPMQKFYGNKKGGKYNGNTEYNHIGSDNFGPKKDNHLEACPFWWTHEEREKKCLSQQVAVWGTGGAARLEGIKKKLDPNNLFQCQKCIGYNDGIVAKTCKTKK